MRAVRTAFIAMLPSVAKHACSHAIAFGHTRRQIAPHQDRLAVPRAFAAVRHALADLEIGHRGVARRHHAGAGVPQHGILGEFRAHLRERRGRPGLHRHIPDLAQVRRIVGHFLSRLSRWMLAVSVPLEISE